jgi:hypothetical protein
MDIVELQNLYSKGASMNDIALKYGCSIHKVTYWMDKHQIKRRSISDAIYLRHNPNGDPFKIKPITTLQDAELYGMGIGLYWGEGTKASKYSVRLGNSDPKLIKSFMTFLIKLFSVRKEDMRFGLQLFSDTDPQKALDYWVKNLGVKPSQFYKITVTISGSIGTYRNKNINGVLTVHYHNKKLRDIIVGMLPR